MNFLNKIKSISSEKKLSLLVIALFSVYFVVRFSYFTIDVFNPDETWHSGYMDSSLLKQFKSYQAFSPLYWTFGHIIIKVVGYSDIAFGKIFLRLFFIGFYFYSIFLIYKIAKKKEGNDGIMIFLVIFFILSAPISFFGGKAITPEYLQLFLFSICLYKLSSEKNTLEQYVTTPKLKKFFLFLKKIFRLQKNELHVKHNILKSEKYSTWFLAGIAAGLKLHALAILPFLFFFRTIFLEAEIKRDGFFAVAYKLAKVAVPFSVLGLLVANFPILTNFHETKEAFANVGGGGLDNVISKLKFLLFKADNPQCWEANCPFYVRDGYSHLIYNIVPPLSVLFVVMSFAMATNSKRNISIFYLFIFSTIFIEIFIATGYANYPWYHLIYAPLSFSLLLYLDIKNLHRFRRYSIYTLMLAGIICNLMTTIYLIKTDYDIRRKSSALIQRNAKNTLCVDGIISQEKPDAYIFGVISVFNGYSSSFIDSDSLIERHFKSSPKMFRTDGALDSETINDLAKNKKLKLIVSIDEVSAIYNPILYDYKARIASIKSNFEKQWQNNFPNKRITSEIKLLKACSGIKNYALEVVIK